MTAWRSREINLDLYERSDRPPNDEGDTAENVMTTETGVDEAEIKLWRDDNVDRSREINLDLYERSDRPPNDEGDTAENVMATETGVGRDKAVSVDKAGPQTSLAFPDGSSFRYLYGVGRGNLVLYSH